MDDKYLFSTQQYNALAAIMSDILHNTHPEHLPVATSLFMRMTNGMALRSSNIQVGRFMSAAGIPDSADVKLTKRW